MMKKLLVTGSAGLIGSETVRFFSDKGFQIYGIDNDMRSYFFGKDASTRWNLQRIRDQVKNYTHYNVDIRNQSKVEEIFKKERFDLIIHTAAQPSHDWASKEPLTDFNVNAIGTLNLLENLRKYCPEAVFIFTSTNKVYGDTPNTLPIIEQETRYELPKGHKFFKGIDESMSIDNSKHSLFGVSKAAADIMVQEYGKYFGLRTTVFRGGCLTGPSHSGTKLHGFLAYLIKCIATGQKYTIMGYKGKQVRDNIHSYDLVNAFYNVYLNPRCGEVYNMGGSRHSNISMIEAIKRAEEIFRKKANYQYKDENRIGDHIWYISDVSKFKNHYPNWNYKYDIDKLIEEICLSGHFSSESVKSSTLTFFEGGLKNRKKLGKAYFTAHVSGAFGYVQALRLYLGTRFDTLISVEHSLRKNKGRDYFLDIYLNLLWFYKNKEDIKVYIGINFINAFVGAMLKKVGYKFKLIYYAVDYSPKRSDIYLLNYLYSKIDKFNVSLSDYVWSGSPEMINLRTNQGISKEKNILVRSGIYPKLGKRIIKEDRENINKTLILDGFLSNNLVAIEAIKSLKIIKKEESSIKLKIFIGRLDKNKLKKVSLENHVDKSIEYIENLSHQKAFDIYKEGGIALALFGICEDDTALYRDPPEIKEFMANGLPILVSKDFKISEEIEASKIGLTVENKSIDIAEKTIYYLNHSEEYKRSAKNSLKYSKDFFWDKIFEKALKLSKVI